MWGSGPASTDAAHHTKARDVGNITARPLITRKVKAEARKEAGVATLSAVAGNHCSAVPAVPQSICGAPAPKDKVKEQIKEQAAEVTGLRSADSAAAAVSISTPCRPHTTPICPHSCHPCLICSALWLVSLLLTILKP